MTTSETTACGDCAEPLSAGPGEFCGATRLHACPNVDCSRPLAEPAPHCALSWRHEESVGGAPMLDWRNQAHAAKREAPCRFCGAATLLRDAARRPAHKVCAEAATFPGGAA